VLERLDEYLDRAARSPDRRPSARQPLRPLLARLLGGAPEEYALVTSTGAGIGIAAAGYPWAPGDNMVLPADEHWNNTFPWLALRERGVDVRIVPVGADQRVDPGLVAEHVDGKTRMVAIAAVRHTTGYRADLKALRPDIRFVKIPEGSDDLKIKDLNMFLIILYLGILL
jgi:cysteine desulfurase/selenocysteine lyase